MSDFLVVTHVDMENKTITLVGNNAARYCFLDVETTGFDSIRNQVLTLACFITDSDYNILGEHYGQFRPDGKRDIVWSEGAEEVHGISWEEALTFPTIQESAEALIKFLDQFPPVIFVAHNTPYDRRMLKGTLSRCDLHFEQYSHFTEYQDTIKLLKESGLVSSKSKSLGLICKELGIEHNHHDAKSDAKVLIEIHRRCMQAINGNKVLTTASETSDSHSTTPEEVFYEYEHEGY